MTKRIIVAVTGASGAPLSVRLLGHLRELPVETHLILSRMAERILAHETDLTPTDLRQLADATHDDCDLFAPPASGTFCTDGMAVVPCSVKTLAAIAGGLADNLIARAADVTLKERRPLVLVVRETPLSAIHIENMRAVTRAGAVILPPVLSFYTRPERIEDLLDHLAGRVLDALGIEHDRTPRWGE